MSTNAHSNRGRRLRSCRRRVLTAMLAALAVGAAFAALPLAAGAVHDTNVFELDGNAVDDSAGAPDDWGTLFPSGTSSDLLGGTFAPDPTDAADVGFGSGLTKDTADVTQWTWEQADVTPGKSDIVDAYAAAYDHAGDLVVYFGQDRLPDRSGNNQVGFWFLQDEVAPTGGPAKGTFTGAHRVGDILVQSDFTGGGDVSRIDVYRWGPSGLEQLTGFTAGECGTGLAGDAACAVANTQPIESPWPYPSDDGKIPAAFFFEGGLNLSKVFGNGAVPCFTTFMATTRASQSESADLKDFALGSLDTCGSITITKDAQPDDGAAAFDFAATGLAPSTFRLVDPSSASRTFSRLAEGTYVVEETGGGAGWAFSSLACSVSGKGTSYAVPQGNEDRVEITLGHMGQASCTYVNKRKPRLELAKRFLGAAGLVDLLVEQGAVTVAEALDVGDGGTTGETTVDPGTYTLSETAGTGTDLGLYTSSLACVDQAAGEAPVALDVADVAVDYGMDVLCTFTNTTLPEVEVVKTADPTSVPETGGRVTFTFTVFNRGVQAIEVTELVDDTFDVSQACAAVVGSTLQPDDGDDAGGPDQAVCQLTVSLEGTAGDEHVDVASVTGVDDAGNEASDEDDATVTFTDVVPTVAVTKTADPASLPEPGGLVTFTVSVQNTSAEPVTLVSLVDSVFGDLDGRGTCVADGTVTIAPGATATCAFLQVLDGQPGDPHLNVVRATVRDDDGSEASDEDDATVTFTDVPSALTVTKTASPTAVQEPGGAVTFTVVVRNDSAVDAVVITSLVDDVYGDLNGRGTCALTREGIPLAPGASFTCSFSGQVSGAGGTRHVDVVTATGTDDDGTELTDSDDAVVNVTSAPPPPPQPTIDVAVTKDDDADPLQLGVLLTYTLRVVNNGPDAATNVRLADPAPTGVAFSSAQPSQGTCSVTPALLECSLGSLAPGASVSVRLVARISVTGTITNTVTVTGEGGPDTNPANNTDSEQTLVVAPLTPPQAKPKPKPKPTPTICATIKVTPKTLRADGSRQRITAKVTAGGKAVKRATVRVSGAGLDRTGRTNAQGVARFVVRPVKTGIVKVSITGAKACNTQRIGVVGVFEPPVTG